MYTSDKEVKARSSLLLELHAREKEFQRILCQKGLNVHFLLCTFNPF